MSALAIAILIYTPELQLFSADEATPGKARRFTLALVWVLSDTRLPRGLHPSVLADTSLALLLSFLLCFGFLIIEIPLSSS